MLRKFWVKDAGRDLSRRFECADGGVTPALPMRSIASAIILVSLALCGCSQDINAPIASEPDGKSDAISVDEGYENDSHDTKSNDSCSSMDLQYMAESFLLDVISGDTDRILSHYHIATPKDQYADLVRYLFASNAENNGIMNIKRANQESPYKTKIDGLYDDGHIVIYYQSHVENSLSDPDFLRTEKFDSLFVCHFTCRDSTWGVSGKSCFEDTGAPYE